MTTVPWGATKLVVAAGYHDGVDAERELKEKVAALLPYLNERQRRLFLAVEARALGHGGVARVARAGSRGRPSSKACGS
jgi:hypothetical protein